MSGVPPVDEPAAASPGPTRRTVLRAGLGGVALPVVAAGGRLGRVTAPVGSAPSPVIDVADHAAGGPIDGPAIRAAIAALPPSGGILHVPPGRHRVAVAPAPGGPPRVADLPGGTEVRADGAVIELVGAVPVGSCVFRAEDVDDLVLRAVRLRGPGGGAGPGSGVVVLGGRRVRFVDVDVAGFPGAGVWLGASSSGEPCRDVTVEGSALVDCSTAGLVAAGVDGLVVSTTTIGRRDEPVVRPSTGVSVVGGIGQNRALRLHGNHVEGCRTGVACAGARDLVVSAGTFAENGVGARLHGDGVVVVANSLHRNRGPAVVVTGTRLRVEANSVNHGGGGIVIAGDPAVVRANLLYNCAGGLVTSPGAVVARNLVEGVEV